MQQLECESNSITCMSCSYVHVYGNKVIYLNCVSVMTKMLPSCVTSPSLVMAD